jgi:hypothetical protein
MPTGRQKNRESGRRVCRPIGKGGRAGENWAGWVYATDADTGVWSYGEEIHAILSSLSASLNPEGPKVCRLTGGASRIRTRGPTLIASSV